LRGFARLIRWRRTRGMW